MDASRPASGNLAPQTLTETRYMRGMDEDHLPGGAKRQVTAPDSKGGELADHPRLNGFVREQITYNGLAGAEVSGAISDPWIKQTAVSGNDRAWLLQTGKTRSRTALAAGGERVTETATSFDDYGMPIAVDDRGDINRDDDDLCTRTSYARNTGAWILDNTSQVQTFSTACSNTTVRPETVVAGTRNYYDGSAALGAVTGVGNLTRADVLTGTPGAPRGYVTTATTAYDAHGRVTEIADAEGRKNTTSYTPATGGPVTQTKTTNPKNFSNTTAVDPAWGLAVTETDENDKRTDLAYDALGRLTGVWLPGRTRSSDPNNPGPHLKFAYLVRANGPTAVSTSELRNNGTYTTSYALFDGLLRPRQTQAPSKDGAGRVLTDTIYDTAGRVLDSNGPYYNTDAPGTDLYSVTDAQIPTQTRNSYDGAGRLTTSTFRVKNADKWRTITTYGGDRVSVDPPEGATATTTISDARGRSVALRQYHGAAPTGGHDETRYTHTPTGQQATVTDPAGNVWKYYYDLQGRQIRADDPDRGTTTTTYTATGEQASVTDARGKTLAYAYDELGRRTATHEGSVTGPKLTEWAFDTLAKGKATSATRWIDGKAYITAVAGYDDLYRPTGSRVTIPETTENGALAKTYASNLDYNLDGGVKTMTLPAAPGLPAETLKFVYDKLGQPNRMAGATSAIVGGTTYSPFGETLQLAMGQTTDKITWQTHYFDEGTRRLQRSVFDRSGFANAPAADVRYSHDPAGNITRISDEAAGQPADTQCFRQDHLRRLTEAWTPGDGNCGPDPSVALLGGPAPYWQSFTHDETGNRLTDIQHRPGGDTTRRYHYPDPKTAQPHTVRKVTTDGPSGQRLDTYDYDDIGNTTTRSHSGTAQKLTWDTEGHLESATDATGTTSYVYDANGTRLLRRDPQGTTLYLDGTEIRLSKTSALSSTRYYTHNGQTIAMRTKDGLKFLGTDHHGTAELAIDGATLAVTRRRTGPFGAPRDTTPVTWTGERGFVGGTIDASTGLTHLGAREYDPGIGRFISVDPLIDHGDPQQMNGYAYANNSPVTFSDPTGLISADSAERLVNNGVDLSGDFNGASNKANGNSGGGSQGPDQLATHRKKLKQHEKQIKKIAKKIVKLAADELGITAGLDCLTKGDLGACAETALNVLSMFVGGVAGKLVTRYGAPWQWKKAAALGKTLWKLGDEAIDAVKGWFKARDELAEAAEKLDNVGGGSCLVPNKSFPPGTKVLLASGAYKPIEKLNVGDKVIATDPVTNKTKASAVVATHIRVGRKNLINLTIDTDGPRGASTSSLTATGNHEFWAANKNAWIRAEHLHTGDQLRAPNAALHTIVKTRHWTAPQRVHNLTVEDIHTFYVVTGDTPALVHNCDFAPGVADQKYDKHVLGLDDAGNPTRRADMPEYDHDGGFEKFEADAKNLMCGSTCPAGARQAVRSDGALIRLDSTGRLGIKQGDKIATFFRPDDPAAYFAKEAAR